MGERWSGTCQFLHWATAALIATALVTGGIANDEEGAAARRLFDAHYQVGCLILLAVIARISWRAYTQAPRPLAHWPKFVRVASLATHLALYGTMLLLVLSGYIIHLHMYAQLKFLGLLVNRPYDPGEDESLRVIGWYLHTWGTWVLIALVTLHTAAALWHHFVRRDETLRRMLPG
jgi:cytochrome b561